MSLDIPDDLQGADVFVHVLDHMRGLFDSKNRDYAGADKRERDTWANFRMAEDLGILPFVSAWVRKLDKTVRIQNVWMHGAAVKNEALEDTLEDDAVYSVIMLALYREMRQRYTPEQIDRMRALYRELAGIIAQGKTLHPPQVVRRTVAVDTASPAGPVVLEELAGHDDPVPGGAIHLSNLPPGWQVAVAADEQDRP